ncbi:flavin reductase family protein [Nocardiopsis algeriensis]|uniref:Flavin reductase (DIM6/NTAB) family NADH-FMN oxidoreductase RutF n=1 Tax=Nocardiopsis algeriensis TaxID=1478215 RepID=A0A841IPX4_9ACTN|nr:flavin reductase family protein [Nocardiopsis algeriensis]MBB6120767.1 flavin reductase (DIM6/NTAB) family NADH-FMN oxidoreductase RutF [Nocardiopsis algeriensis]
MTSDPLAGQYLDAMSMVATGVTVVTVADGRDDVGATVSAFGSVSADPPIVSVSVGIDGYMAEVIEEVGAFAVSVLGSGQRVLAGRFSAEGRPSARLLVSGQPHHRGEGTRAIVLDDALAALECSVRRRVDVGDHAVFFADVTGFPEVRGEGSPLVRWAGRYSSLP